MSERIRSKVWERIERNSYFTTLHQYVGPTEEERDTLQAMVDEGLLERRAYKVGKDGYPNDRGRSTRTCYIKPGTEASVKRLTLLPKVDAGPQT